MHVMSTPSRQKSWQTGRERVSVLAALALHKESVSRRLLKVREDLTDPSTGKALSQEDAAARVGVRGRTWQRWEAGETTPYPRNLEAIADAFGFEVGEFFSGEEEVVSSREARRSETGDQLDRIERALVDLKAAVGSLAADNQQIRQELAKMRDTGRREEPPEGGG